MADREDTMTDPEYAPCDQCAGRGWNLCTDPNCEFHLYFSTDQRVRCAACDGTGKTNREQEEMRERAEKAEAEVERLRKVEAAARVLSEEWTHGVEWLRPLRAALEAKEGKG